MATNKKRHKKQPKSLPVGGAQKQNLMLAKIEAKERARFTYERNAQMRILEQIYADAFCLACSEVFQMGPGRARKAMDAYRKYVHQIATMMVNDGDGDGELSWVFTDIDRALERIVGPENFIPYEKRYDWRHERGTA